jgi:uncharacterized protein (DUF2236 family)
VKNNAFQEFMSVKFRRLLSGDPKGIPPWLELVAQGDKPGYFMPTDAPWIVHRDFGTLVGGIRALLMQALHPGTLAGVAQHSRYEQDALGRLSGTIRWLTTTTFGSVDAVASEASRVNRLHERVTGEYNDAAGVAKPYRASNEDLLLWVHAAFTDSFLTCHQMFAWREIPGGADAYVSQWSKSVAPLGLSRVPMSKAALDEYILGCLADGTLRVDATTLRVVKFIKRPPLPKVAGLVYRVLFAAAVASLRPEVQKMLGLKALPVWFIQPLTRASLKFMNLLIGPESPIEEGALRRLKRIGLLDPSN